MYLFSVAICICPCSSNITLVLTLRTVKDTIDDIFNRHNTNLSAHCYCFSRYNVNSKKALLIDNDSQSVTIMDSLRYI